MRLCCWNKHTLFFLSEILNVITTYINFIRDFELS